MSIATIEAHVEEYGSDQDFICNAEKQVLLADLRLLLDVAKEARQFMSSGIPGHLVMPLAEHLVGLDRALDALEASD